MSKSTIKVDSWVRTADGTEGRVTYFDKFCTLRCARDFRGALEAYATLRHEHTDEVGWIALKLSCSRAEAERWVTVAKKEPTK